MIINNMTVKNDFLQFELAKDNTVSEPICNVL